MIIDLIPILDAVVLRENAAVICDASILISNANDAFNELDFEISNLVDYDLKNSDLKVNDASEQ